MPGLDGALAEQRGAEGVDRPDADAVEALLGLSSRALTSGILLGREPLLEAGPGTAAGAATRPCA